MVSCAVIDCDVTKRNNPAKYTFFRFPKNLVVREKWLKVINRTEWTPKKNSTICSKHFEEKCIIQRQHRQVLKKDSIPTLFVPVQIKPKRRLLSNIYRDVLPPSPPEPAPGPSSQVELTPRKKKLVTKCTNLKKKIELKNKMLKNLRAKNRRMGKRIVTLQAVLKDLEAQPGLKDHRNDVQLACTNNVLQTLVDCVNKRASGNLAQTAAYDESIRKFALTVHFYSPRSYSYIRQKFDLGLPHPNSLRNWYSRLDCEPGFTKESLNTITEMAKVQKVYVNLTFDEIKIRDATEMVGKKMYGHVNIGNDLDSDEAPLAKEILVFLVVAVTGYWKLPVGFFPCNSFTASEKAHLLKTCLSLLSDTNCEVMAITFDGISSNLNMAKILGADFNSPPYRPFFHFEGRRYNLLFDACHLLKLIRNHFHNQSVLTDYKNRKIEFRYVENLLLLQLEEGLHLANKLSVRHVHFSNQKMKVHLAAQLLSRSVAVAIDVCDKDLQLESFKNSEATVEFLLKVNDVFDIFNSRNLNNFGFKKPLSRHNKDEIFAKLDEVHEYFASLKTKDGKSVIHTPFRLGFLGFILDIQTLKWLYVNYVEEKESLTFIPTYKLSQDHLETFFSAIRARGGFNNNPTVARFISAYKRLLCHSEIKLTESGNCIELENMTIVSVTSHLTLQRINKSMNYNKILNEIEINAPKEDDDDVPFRLVDHDYCRSAAPLTETIVTYIAGFVVKKIRKIINCEDCTQALVNQFPEVTNYAALILKRDFCQSNQGYLVQPSRDVIYLCIKCENIFRNNMKKKCINEKMYAKNVLSVLRDSVTLFQSLKYHVFDQEPLCDHRYLLMKGIVETYFDLRLKYESKLMKTSKESLRMYLNKIVLFRGD